MAYQFALTSLRFEDVRQQCVDFLKERGAYTAEFDYQGSNIAYIIDTMAYTTMLMSYMLASQANESFIDTAVLRKNAVSIAKTMGYRPRRVRASRLEGTFFYGPASTPFTAESKVVIPAKTYFTGELDGLTWVNTSPIVLEYDPKNPFTLSSRINTTKPVTYVVQGVFKEYRVLGNGESMQSFTIPSVKVDNDNMRLYVKNTSESDLSRAEWQLVKTFYEITQDEIYFLEEDLILEGSPKVIFGNNIVGRPPKLTETIIIDYLETVGPAGNGETNVTIPDDIVLNKSFDIKTVDRNLLGFRPISTKSFGGSDKETKEEIAETAPRFFAAAGRAVTGNDFKTLIADQFGDIVSYYNVVGGDELYPGSRDALGNAYITATPLTGEENQDFLKNTVLYLAESQEAEIISKLKQIGIIATRKYFYKPTYLYLVVQPTIEISSSASTADQEALADAATIAIETYFKENLYDFAKPYRVSKIKSSVDAIDGIISTAIETNYSFLLNSDTFYTNRKTILYMPVRHAKDENGIVRDEFGNKMTTNFVKKNSTLISEANIGSASLVELFRIDFDGSNNPLVTTVTPVWNNKEDAWSPYLTPEPATGHFELTGTDASNTYTFWVGDATASVYYDPSYLSLFDYCNAVAAAINALGKDATAFAEDGTGVGVWSIELSDMSASAGVVTTPQAFTADTTGDYRRKWKLSINDEHVADAFLYRNKTINVNGIVAQKAFLQDTVEIKENFIVNDRQPTEGITYNSIQAQRVFTSSNYLPEEVGGVIVGRTSLFGSLTHPYLNRYLYNSDEYDANAFKLTIVEKNQIRKMLQEQQTFRGRGDSVWTSSLFFTNRIGEVYEYNISFSDSATATTTKVGTLFWDATAGPGLEQFEIYITESEEEFLRENGFVTDTYQDQFGTDIYTAFTITDDGGDRYIISVRLAADVSAVKMGGKNRAFVFAEDGTDIAVFDSHTMSLPTDTDELVPLSVAYDGTNVNCSWDGDGIELNLVTVSRDATGHLGFSVSLAADATKLAEFGLYYSATIERFRLSQLDVNNEVVYVDGYAVYFFDSYHRSTLGNFEYSTGEAEFELDVWGRTDDVTPISTKIKTLFDNYTETVPSDAISITPDNETKVINSVTTVVGTLTDFDGIFSQAIRPYILNVETLLV